MPKLTFYPLDNADCCLVDLDDGQKLLFDYADAKQPDDENDKRIDLPSALKEDLDHAKRNYYDVVAFSHLDLDHIKGFQDFFYLEHASKYQGDSRIKIDELWVPAAAITEEGIEDDARILRQEARYRFKAGKGIRVFSRPQQLKQWCRDNGVPFDERTHLITDAGRFVPGFNETEIKFFVHSPFASRLDENTVIDRNADSLALHVTFICDGQETKLFLGSDLDHEALTEIVNITKKKNNEHYLEWDVFKLPHHCSYLSLGPNKGEKITEPVPNVKWLYEEQSQEGAIIVSPSKPIPSGYDDTQPPHRQAAEYYKKVVNSYTLNGQFIVTMEHPSTNAPDKLIIQIGKDKAMVQKRITSGPAVVISRPTPRAG